MGRTSEEKNVTPTAKAPESSAPDTRAEAVAIAQAMAEYYEGKSLPFKPAHRKLSPLNPSNGKSATVRQAALIAAILAYGQNLEVTPEGVTFTRTGFTVPFGKKGKPKVMAQAKPESGCLGNLIGGGAIVHTGGALDSDDAQFTIPIDKAKEYLALLPQRQRKASYARLARLAKAG